MGGINLALVELENKLKKIVLPLIGDKHYVLLTLHGERKFQHKQKLKQYLTCKSTVFSSGPYAGPHSTHVCTQQHDIKSNS